MTTIPHIDSSIRGSHSVSRSLTGDIVASMLTLHQSAQANRRDLIADAALHFSDAHLAAFQGGDIGSPMLGQDLGKGGAYLDNLFVADIVVSAPMSSLSVPTQINGWIDWISVARRTFKYGPNGAEGLAHGKKIFIASTRVDAYTGDSPMAKFGHQERSLRTALGFVGSTDVTLVRAEGLNMGGATMDHPVAETRTQIMALAA